MTSAEQAAAATDAPSATAPNVSIESFVDQAKRAFALKKYEQAVEHYANALELMTEMHGEDAPETADLYFAYGMALLENAVSQNSVLGKEQAEEGPQEESAAASGSGLSKNGPILSFSGDAEDAEGDDPAVDLFAQATKDIAEAEAEAAAAAANEEDDDGEPEDDFNAAWEVLDLARAIYDKKLSTSEDDDEVKLKLADTFIALGDVSLETEKFDQAISDYESGLKLKTTLLPLSSRQIAEAHYKLSIVLDLTSGRLADSISHAEKALESVETRLAELKAALSSETKPELPAEQKVDVKGKGKATGARLARDNPVQAMSTSQIEAEIKELSGLKEDLALKVEELKTSPTDAVETSAPALAAQQLDKELKATSIIPSEAPVNDLTSMVVKKKRKAPTEDSSAVKRKAEDEPTGSPGEKKAKLEGEST